MTISAANRKLTDVRLRALLDRPPSERIELKDGTIDGLTLRVGPRGRPTWTFRFRVRGEGGITERGTKLNGVRYHCVSLGSYPDVTIKEARRKAAAYADDAAAGRNPLTDFEERAVDKRDTVAALVEDYVAHFLVCLPVQAMTVIDTLTRWNEGDFMLSTTNGAKPIAGVPRKIIDQLHSGAEKILGSPMPRFALHDFRRSVRTHLSRLEVDAHVSEMVLGHAIKGLRASYDLYGYSREKRHALALWATDLLSPAENEESNGVTVLSTALEALTANAPLSEEQREALLGAVRQR